MSMHTSSRSWPVTRSPRQQKASEARNLTSAVSSWRESWRAPESTVQPTSLHVAGSEAGLATGMMAVWSGCVWGQAEWGVPWDWTDVRLNSFGLLTLLAMVLVFGRRAQPDGVESRDTFATVGLFGFLLVPFTYMATRIWQIRHPGPVIAAGDDGGSLAPSMTAVLLLGVGAFTVLIAGHVLESLRLTKLEQRLNRLQLALDAKEVVQ